jgi:hypothetical protein
MERIRYYLEKPRIIITKSYLILIGESCEFYIGKKFFDKLKEALEINERLKEEEVKILICD